MFEARVEHEWMQTASTQTLIANCHSKKTFKLVDFLPPRLALKLRMQNVGMSSDKFRRYLKFACKDMKEVVVPPFKVRK